MSLSTEKSFFKGSNQWLDCVSICLQCGKAYTLLLGCAYVLIAKYCINMIQRLRISTFNIR